MQATNVHRFNRVLLGIFLSAIAACGDEDGGTPGLDATTDATSDGGDVALPDAGDVENDTETDVSVEDTDTADVADTEDVADTAEDADTAKDADTREDGDVEPCPEDGVIGPVVGTCACADGYVLDDEEEECVDVDECAEEGVGVDACRVEDDGECENTEGAWSCTSCPEGYAVSDDALTCADIDECATDPAGDGAMSCKTEAGGTCENVEGSWTCTACPTGYSVADDLLSCADINECDADNGGCDTLTTCTNIDGGRTCSACPEGYTGNGVDGCEDVDECQTENGGCDTLTTCTNIDGGRTCGACPEGYTGNGVDGCEDVNECLTENGGCDTLTTCTNIDGGRTCGACPEGYSGTGADGCTNINECEADNGGCDANATCEDTEGSRTCTCDDGFVGDGETCAAGVRNLVRGSTPTTRIDGHFIRYGYSRAFGLEHGFIIFDLSSLPASISSATLTVPLSWSSNTWEEYFSVDLYGTAGPAADFPLEGCEGCVAPTDYLQSLKHETYRLGNVDAQCTYTNAAGGCTPSIDVTALYNVARDFETRRIVILVDNLNLYWSTAIGEATLTVTP